jgi:hypothetical protein
VRRQETEGQRSRRMATTQNEALPMEQQEICAGFEAASDQVIQLLHFGATLSESQQLQIKHTIEVLRLTYDDWVKIVRLEKPAEALGKPAEPVATPPQATH